MLPLSVSNPIPGSPMLPNLDLPREETGLIALAGGESFSGQMWLEITDQLD